MNILQVNTFDQDGGAARAARRLHDGLRDQGVHSQMLAQTKTSNDPDTFQTDDFLHRTLEHRLPLLDALPLGLYPNRDVSHWANGWFPTSLRRQIRDLDPDIVHLHWICRGLLSLRDLRRWGKPIVWTLHDSWAFTGGCHCPPDGCRKYEHHCGACPALGSKSMRDLSRFNLARKQALWSGLPLHVVTPSHWLAGCAQRSRLFSQTPVSVIPNPIDTTRYAPGSQADARAELGVPQDRTLILLVAMNASSDQNKGWIPAMEAIQHAAALLGPDAAELVIAGDDGTNNPQPLPWNVHWLGVLDEEKMIAAYRAADVLLLPSLLENLSNAVMEAGACSLPSLAFDAGGTADLIRNGKSGLLSPAYDTHALGQALLHLIEHPHLREDMGKAARTHIKTLGDLETISQTYEDLYASILAGDSP